MKALRILVFIGVFLFSGLAQGKVNGIEIHKSGLTSNSVNKVKDSIEIPELFFAGDTVETQQLEKFKAKLDRLYAKLRKKKDKFKSQKAFYEYLYFQVHRKMLKNFCQEAVFADLVDDGTYNCLTASLLYSHILNALAIEHEILEYPFHVNLLITEGESRILLETTDALTGFLVKDEEIEKNIMHYQMGGGKGIDILPSVANSYQKVNFQELIGLLFFNKAVYLINKGNIAEAHLAVKQARELYPSGRLNDLENYLASIWGCYYLLSVVP